MSDIKPGDIVRVKDEVAFSYSDEHIRDIASRGHHAYDANKLYVVVDMWGLGEDRRTVDTHSFINPHLKNGWIAKNFVKVTKLDDLLRYPWG